MKDKLKNEIALLQNEIDEIKLKADDLTVTLEDLELVKAKMEQKKTLLDQVKVLEALEADTKAAAEVPEMNAAAVVPSAAQIQATPTIETQEYPLGVYMQDLVKHVQGHQQTRVLEYQKMAYHELEVMAAATGAGEAIPSDGGFLVGTDMAGTIAERAYNSSELAPRCDPYEITTNANGVKVLAIDETSRADGSRHGGVRHYWLAEAAAKTASKPKWRKAELELKKGAILFYTTDELLADAALLQSKVESAVSDEMAFAIQDGIVNGNGTGQPLGIINGGSLISITKETGQVAATIVYENTVKMYARFYGSEAGAIWIANRDIFPQLAVMNLAVGTGGAPVWIPANGAAGSQYNTLHGYPLIFIEQCETLGTVGDLILCDFSQYMLARKGGIQAAMSIHVQFLEDETVFRWVHRADGQPAWNSALTPYKGTNTVSPFIALETRS